jgi:hypothetical protein
MMADALLVIIRFTGDPGDLADRVERARQLWIEAQQADYERPTFYAVCRSGDGIAIVSCWDSASAHRAFGQGLHTHIEAAGLGMPEQIERMRVVRVGWD